MQRLLIVDDETPMAETLAALFSAERIAAANAPDRTAAEELIRAEFFPVILADVRLKSEEEGLQLLDSIRMLSPRSKVASVTGYATPALEQELRARGAELVLYKQVQFQLLRVVRQLLGADAEESEAGSAEPLDFEELYEKLGGLLHVLPARRYGLSADETDEMLAHADDRTRRLSCLIGMEKRSYEEVSRELGLPLGSIGPLYMRAKAKLKSAMVN